jgi:hypothetical protein
MTVFKRDWVVDLAMAVDLQKGRSILATLSAIAPDLDAPDFEERVAAQLRTMPDVVDRWQGHSYDQRSSPNPYLDGLEVGFYDAGHRNIRMHAERADACADFIHRLTLWVLARKVPDAG